MCDMPQVAYIVGWVTMIIVIIRLINITVIYLLPSRKSGYAHISSNGEQPWALVTGASDGLGKAFVYELAAKGFNVMLHGRNHIKLSLVVSRMKEEYPDRRFRILVADASTVPCLSCIRSDKCQQKHDMGEKMAFSETQTPIDFNTIRTAVSEVHLTVLINNAGGGLVDPTFAPLGQTSAARITTTVSLNALFPLHLMRELLPLLSGNTPALIMNIGSFSDDGLPLISSYGASKQFLMKMTRAVRLEMELAGRASEVELLGIRAGKITGGRFYKSNPSLFAPDSHAVARAALDRVGWGHGLVIGHWAHALQGLGVGLLPSWLEEKLHTKVMQKEQATEVVTEYSNLG